MDVICRAENVWPLPLATWWRKGSLVRHGDYHDSFILLRPTDNMLTMRIFGTEGYHHGTYTCVAKNMFGTATEEVNIMVQRKQTVLLDLNFSFYVFILNSLQCYHFFWRLGEG